MSPNNNANVKTITSWYEHLLALFWSKLPNRILGWQIKPIRWKHFVLDTNPDGIHTMGDVVLLPSGSVVIGNTSYGTGQAIQHVFGRYRAKRNAGFNETLYIEDGTETFRFVFGGDRWYRTVPHIADPGEGGILFAVKRNIETCGLFWGVVLSLFQGAMTSFVMAIKLYFAILVVLYVLVAVVWCVSQLLTFVGGFFVR